MSINLMDRVWYREDLRTMEKFVALALADSAGDDGACYPSIIRIAKKCSCVPRTVQIALRDLERRQLVRRYRRKDRSEEHTSELPSLMRNSYAVFCLKKKTNKTPN